MLHVLQARDWSMNRLAREAGVAASTINRPLRDRDWPYPLKPDTIARIHRASGIDPRPFVAGEMAEPAEMYASPREAAPKPEASAKALHQTAPLNVVDLYIENGTATVLARLDRAGLDALRRKLDALEVVLSSD